MIRLKGALALFVCGVSLYAGVWYYGCVRLDQRLSRREFSWVLGPNKDVAVHVEMKRGDSHFVGWLQGAVGVEFQIQSISSTASIKLPDSKEPQHSKTVMIPGKAPLMLRVSVPIWGNSLSIDTAAFEDLHYEMQMGEKRIEVLHSADAGKTTIEFARSAFALQRERDVDAMIADPKVILDTVSGFQFAIKARMLNAGDRAEVMKVSCNGGGIHWSIGADGMLNLSYDLDAEFRYGPGFASWLDIAQIPVREESQSLSSQFREIFVKAQQEILVDTPFITRGTVRASLPANRLGLREMAAAEDTGFPVPPFEVSFDDFTLRAPILLMGLTSLDGTVSFMRGTGKPISVDLRQKREGFGLERLLTKLLPLARTSPPFSTKEVDIDKDTLASIETVEELLSSQGAFVSVVSTIRALAQNFYDRSASNTLKFALTTGSGNANVFELMGAKGALDFKSAYDNGFGFGLKGSMNGIVSWSGSLEVQKPVEFVRTVREPLSLFLGRAFLSTFFLPEPTEGPREPAAQEREKKMLKLFFSDDVFNKALGALEAVVRQVDQSPESSDELRIELAGSASDVRVNGKTLQEFSESLERTFKTEGERLKAELEPQFEALRPTPSDPEQTL